MRSELCEKQYNCREKHHSCIEENYDTSIMKTAKQWNLFVVLDAWEALNMAKLRN
jgi:hypothetical protein